MSLHYAAVRLEEMVSRILYSGTRNASSWAFRAWLALREAQVDFEEHIVDIRVPQRFENLARIQAFSPPGAVPVLVDGDHAIFDSLAIMEYANDRSGGRLLPSDPVIRAIARSLLAWQHSGLSGLCARLSFESAFYPERRAMTEDEQAQTERIAAAWESTLKRGGGPWLTGDLSLADLAFVPTVIRLLAHGPDLSAYPLSEQWASRLLQRPSVNEWMQQARDLPPVYLDDYQPA
ncbi:glutathione S-transferase family protein [Lysobacter sp. cf310]|uniref:glutathione S-transferase family protein n=1 Tax=Lysobacter sp. cf310 TaxID=1761790 RepID=UPI0008EF4604|nr:glutathione S-transferase family protein [Lysobacter sp. cf310]SFK73524.1 glutathione S-transferase [Lysobacter sp. cf310]